MIKVENISKSFQAVKALDTVGFTASDGCITGLVGPNGAGKTTLMRILYTVLAPDSGRIGIDGLDLRGQRRAAQRRIGILPDTRGLYPRLTAREQIRYHGQLHGWEGGRLEQRIDEVAAALGMDDIIDRRSKGFSRGQTLKVGLARALLHDPPNLMFDEPTNGLDVASSRALRDLVRDLRARGRCILFCSHIIQEVAALCDRLVVLSRGRVVADATPDELRAATGKDDMEEVLLAITQPAAA